MKKKKFPLINYHLVTRQIGDSHSCSTFFLQEWEQKVDMFSVWSVVTRQSCYLLIRNLQLFSQSLGTNVSGSGTTETLEILKMEEILPDSQ